MKRGKRVLWIILAVLVYFGWRWGYTQLFLKQCYAAGGETREVTILLTDFPYETAYGYSVTGKLLGVTAQVYLNSIPTDLKPGDTVTGLFALTAGYQYGRHLTASQRYGELAVNPADQFRYIPARIARAVNRRVDLIFPHKYAVFIRGLLTGDTTGFTEKLRGDLSAAGMSHVASVSGLHVSMLAGFVMLFFRNRRAAFFICVPLIFLYVAVAGFPWSAIRSGVMYTLLLLAPLVMREYNALRALLISLAVILTVQPYAIEDAGLQLSFTATLGIILFSRPLQHFFHSALNRFSFLQRFPRLTSAAASTAAASLAALVFSTPVAAVSFGGVSLLSPLSNFALLWMLNAVFLLAPAAMALSLISVPLGLYLSYPVRWLLDAYLWVLDWIGQLLPVVLYTSQTFMVIWLVFAYAALILGFVWKTWKLPLTFSLAMLVLSFGLTLWDNRRWGLEITVLDVGQGQCVVVRSGGQTAVIDCGGREANAGKRAREVLAARWEREADYLLLTHPNMKSNLYTRGLSSLTARMEILATPDITERQILPLGEAELEILPISWREEGGTCLILRYREFSLVLIPEVTAAGRRWLLRVDALPQNGLLLLDEYGSSEDMEWAFLDALKPQAVLISNGSGRGDIPAAALTELFEAAGIPVYETRLRGDLRVLVPNKV